MNKTVLKLKRRLFSTSQEQIEDYVAAIRDLFWQRQGIFLAVFVLTFVYLDVKVAILCYVSVIAAEALDYRIARIVASWRKGDNPDVPHVLGMIILSTLLSAFTISNFVVSFAVMQAGTGHFPPLFFLFAAALFAAMNNHQIFAALVIREIIYAIGFVVVALIDVVRYAPPLNHQIWLNFFTVLFVVVSLRSVPKWISRVMKMMPTARMLALLPVNRSATSARPAPTRPRARSRTSRNTSGSASRYGRLIVR